MISRLNGEPVGPELPSPIACTMCGTAVYYASELVVADQGTGEPIYAGDLVLEQVATVPGQSWSLRPHICRAELDDLLRSANR